MKNNLVWFTNNLRTIDNTCLTQACEGDRVVAVYCFDPRHFGKTPFGFDKTGKYRAKFLLETVANLQKNLRKLNIPLFIFCDKPETIIPQIVEKLAISEVFCLRDWTSEEKQVVGNLKASLPFTVTVTEIFDQFLFHPDTIPYKSYSDIPRVFTEFRKKCEKACTVQKPLSVPSALSTRNWIENDFPIALPTLDDLGLHDFSIDERSAMPFQGGEDSAWQRLDHYFWKTENLKRYKETRNGLLGTAYSSKFSAWLANGSISPRSIYAQVKQFETDVQKNEDTYWLKFELIWRDFFKYVSLKHGNVLFKRKGILDKNYSWQQDSDAIDRWIAGKTPYPFVNANMVEIAKTGFMSNRGRQIVASFLSKELQVDWRIGASYFESMLIDYDVHSNWGNWQYVSGIGNDPRDRKFNIESQAQRYDPNGDYVAQWLSENN